MMDERRENISALLFAFLTERVPCQVSVTNPAPRAAIPLVLIVPTREVLIVSLHRLLVRLAITAFSVCKLRTACHAAGTLRLSRHTHPPPFLTIIFSNDAGSRCFLHNFLTIPRIQKGHRRSCVLIFSQTILYHETNRTI